MRMRIAIGFCLAVLCVGCGSNKIGGGSGSPVLASACTFGVLAGQSITNINNTTVSGDIGVSPATSVTGFPPGTFSGANGTSTGAAATAQSDLTKAYLDLAGRTAPAPQDVSGADLGGTTKAPGLYKSTSTLSITGDVTLAGPADGVWVFQIASSLTTANGSRVVLTGGAVPKNVSWQVGSSATIGTTSAFQGNILALTSIALNNLATLNGRALARNGAVTLDGNTITVPTTCQ
jgi:ice-binding like protein